MKKKFIVAFVVALIMMLCLPVMGAAALIDKYAEPVEVVRSGSFDTTDQTKMDFSLEGGTLTEAKWTVVRHGAIYTLDGTFKEGEDVSLSIVGTESPLPDDSGRVFNYMKMELAFLDSNNNLIGEKQTYFSDYIKDSTISHTLGGPIPSETAVVKISGVFNCRWATQVVVEEGVAVYVTLKAEKPPAVAMPTEQATEPTSESIPEPTQESEPEITQPTTAYKPEKETVSEPTDKMPWISEDPWEHAGPMATAIISVIAAIAAVLGGAVGSGAATAATMAAGVTGEATGTEGSTADAQDPAYEKAKVPEYPEYVVGQEGERITKKPDGNIEATFPNGEIAIYFPNGTVQVKSPDGKTWEEWPDGTVSTTEDGQFIVKKPDGTMTVREPDGGEIEYNPDGTSVETRTNGMKIKKDAQGETVSTEKDGFIVTKHPNDPNAKIMTSPHGGSVVVREKEKTETFRNTEGKWERRTVYEPVLEGEIRSENATHTFKPDGSIEYKGDDGSVGTQDKDGNIDLRGADGTTYQKHANGSINASTPDGTELKYNSETGEIDYKFSDGSYVKGNEQTGELDAKMTDGSYWKRDTKGNGNFHNKEKDISGVSSEDGSFKIESKDGTIVQQADGTMELKAKDGMTLTQKPDGTATLQKPDGTVIPIGQ
jgi:hypothetical protein